jgi:hypothetical protein
MDLVTHGINNNNTIHVIFLDFVKAFDKVPHEYLLHKLKSYGILGDLFLWCKSFLTDRRQSVFINGTTSSWKPIRSGVIQGSVLGPLLYILYTNDLSEIIINHGLLYADDTNIISVNSSSPTVTTHPNLQTDLNNIYAWAQTWKTPLNLDKCFSMHISRPGSHVDPVYKIGNVNINPCKSIKNLGITISHDLSWSKHVQYLSSETMFQVRQLQRALSSPSPTTIEKIYKSILRPKLEYANIIWPLTKESDIKTLEKVQRKATKWGCLRHKSYINRLKCLNLTSLDARRLRQDCIQLFKHFSKIQPLPWINPPFIVQRGRGHQFKFSSEAAKHHTFPPRYCFLTNRASQHWNTLPSGVVTVTSVHAFKVEYDKFIRTKGA